MELRNFIIVRKKIDAFWQRREEEGLERALELMEDHIHGILKDPILASQDPGIAIAGYKRLLEYFPGNKAARAYIGANSK